jgi:hypothetical protein
MTPMDPRQPHMNEAFIGWLGPWERVLPGLWRRRYQRTGWSAPIALWTYWITHMKKAS